MLRNRWFDRALAQVERARVALTNGEADVLLLGDSSSISLAHSDTDRRLLPGLLAESARVRVATIAGAGYDARMFSELLRVLSAVEQRPRAVVVSATIRTNTAVHVTDHPVHGHERSRRALARVRPGRRIRAFGRGGTVWRDDEMAEFRKRLVTTRWGGTKSIGEHVQAIQGQGGPPWPPGVEEARFDYFHGEVVHPDNKGLAALTALGHRIAEYGVPAVAYWAQPPVAHGERLFPGEFADHVARNLDLVESALTAPGSGVTELIKPVLDDPDFQDIRNGTEHYSFSGRLKIAEALATSLEPACR